MSIQPKSPKIRERLNEMLENGSPVVRDNVRALLASADKQGTSLVKNASFEKGKEFWELEVDTQPFPSDYPFPEETMTETGTSAIREKDGRSESRYMEVSADRVQGTTDIRYPASIMQTIPYEPGSYYVTVSYFLAPGSRRTSPNDLSIQVLDEKGEVLPQSPLPPIAIKPISGRWGRGVGIFTLPSNPNAKSLRIALKLGMLDLNYDYDPKLKVYIDDFDVVRVESNTPRE